MTVDLLAAAEFMAGYARVLDRRRFELLERDNDYRAGPCPPTSAHARGFRHTSQRQWA
jgi:hypothetical protein